MSKKAKKSSTFTISLDFELFWGIHDAAYRDSYRPNLDGVQTIVPQLLALFARYDIRATWAIVGFLFYRQLDDLKQLVIDQPPTYKNSNCSPYHKLAYLKHEDQAIYIAPRLIECIQKYHTQEIATHTFSHYYCCEPGQNAEQFSNDLSMAKTIASDYNVDLNSIVFPRNQVRYLSICEKNKLRCYRGNPPQWFYQYQQSSLKNTLARISRLFWSSIPHNLYTAQKMINQNNKNLINIPATIFLRPYNQNMPIINRIQLHNIKRNMRFAAKYHHNFHLWWHPHNFGINQQENLIMLNEILHYYLLLHDVYGMCSLSMIEVAQLYE